MLCRDFYTKPRNVLWIREHGFEAIAILQVVWIASSQEKDGRLPKEYLYLLPYPLSFSKEKLDSVVKSAVAVGLLEETETHFFNSRIQSNQQNFIRKAENYRAASLKRQRLSSGTYAKSIQDLGEDSTRILPETSPESLLTLNINNRSLLKEGECEGKQEKVEIPIWPRGNRESKIRLTDEEVEKLTKKLGIECFKYQARALHNFLLDSPKKKYPSHYRTILRWHDMKIQKALEWDNEHPNGPNYYPTYELDRVAKQKYQNGGSR
jgi:hypothetical protein